MASTILYVAGNKGVFTVKKNGGDWRVENHSLDDWNVHKIAVSAAQPNRVFAGTRGDGVWVSDDFTRKWTKPCYGKPGPGKVRCVTLHPNDPNTVYAGAEPIDLFVSRDGAKSWTKLDSVRKVPSVESFGYPVATVEPHVRDITFDPKNPKTLYVALQVGYMLKSTDDGQTWRLLDKGIDADVHAIVVHPQNGNRLYITTGGESYRKGLAPGRALYMSEDGGESWSSIARDFEEEYSVPLAMNPQKPDVIYAALANGNPGEWRRPSGAESWVIRSKDGGKNWEKLENGLSEARKNFAECLVVDEADPDRIYAGMRSGELYASEDGGDHWTRLGVKLPAISDMKCVHA